MNLVKLIEALRQRLKTVIYVGYGVLALVVLLDIAFVHKGEAHTDVERLPGFWAVFGFVACTVIVLVSKWFGHAGIMTREDYYDRQDAEESAPPPAHDAHHAQGKH